MEGQEKTARKRSNDPKQEQLRGHKDQWNKEVSLLIAQLIAFKRGLNGRGEPRVGLPPSSIKEPMPNEVGQYLEQMAARFQKVVSEADDIIDEQTEYSKTRRKGRKELQESGQMPPQEMIPSAAASEALLIKEASWWGSRLWSYFKYSPRIWNKHLQLRMRMLWVSSDVSNGLIDLENYLVSSDENAIPRACFTLVKMRNRIISDMAVTFEKMLKEATQAIAEQPKPAQPEESTPVSTVAPESNLPKPLSGKEEPFESTTSESAQESSWDPNINWAEVDRIQNDLTSANPVVEALESQNIISNIEAKNIRDLIKKLITSANKNIGYRRINDVYLQNPESATKMKADVDEFFSKYTQIFGHLSKVLSSKSGGQFNSFTEMLPVIKSMLATGKSPDVNKLAHNWLSRMIKRWQLNILPSYTDKIRLKCVDIVRDLHKDVGDFQDLLENKDSNMGDAAQMLQKILVKFATLSNSMVDLVQNHNTEYEEKKLSDKKNIKIVPVHARNIRILEKARILFENKSGDLASLIENLKNAIEGKPIITEESEGSSKKRKKKPSEEILEENEDFPEEF